MGDACRAGSTTDYYWGENMSKNTHDCPSIDDYACMVKILGGKAHPVGQKKLKCLWDCMIWLETCGSGAVTWMIIKTSVYLWVAHGTAMEAATRQQH